MHNLRLTNFVLSEKNRQTTLEHALPKPYVLDSEDYEDSEIAVKIRMWLKSSNVVLQGD